MNDHASVVVHDVRLFDGTTRHERATVVAVDGVITQVIPGGGPAPLAQADAVDGTGRTLLPGLIDSHTHAGDAADLVQALKFGVTTELDLFADPRSMRELKTLAGQRNDLADVRSAGTGATAPGGHPTTIFPPFPTFERPDEAEAFVADRIAEGSDFLKVVIDGGAARHASMPTLSQATVAALVKAAHRHDLLVVAHATDQAAARAAVEAGVDGLAHLFVDAPPAPDFADLLVRHGVFVIPTLAVLTGLWGDPAGAAALRDDPRVRPRLDQKSIAMLSQGGFAPPGARQGPGYAREALAQVHAAGVPILAGTDAGNPSTAHGAGLHHELALLVDAGLSPESALTAATAALADRFRLSDRGRIAVGNRADLLLVDGDPTHDITATRDVVAVWRGGVRLAT